MQLLQIDQKRVTNINNQYGNLLVKIWLDFMRSDEFSSKNIVKKNITTTIIIFIYKLN